MHYIGILDDISREMLLSTLIFPYSHDINGVCIRQKTHIGQLVFVRNPHIPRVIHSFSHVDTAIEPHPNDHKGHVFYGDFDWCIERAS